MGGGMVAPMPQPTYMDLMPQQMGIPREAQGIMASSQPLVDAIAGDANNPAGGDTLSMAQGGAVGFAPGGIALGQVPASFQKGQIDTLTPEVVFERGAGTVSKVPQNPIRMDFDTILNETDAERLERIFPEAAKNRFQATYEQLYPRDPDGPPRSYAGETARRFLSGVADFAGSQMEEVGQDISAIYKVLFTGEGREQFGDRDKDTIPDEIGTARAVAELIQRRPDLKDRILPLSKKIIDTARRDGIELDGKRLKNTIAYSLSLESEINPNIGFATAQADADRPAIDPDVPPPEPDIGLAGGPTALDAAQQAVLGEPSVVDERDPIDDSLAITNEKGEIDPDDDSDVPRPIIKKPEPPPSKESEATTTTSEAAAAAAEGEASATEGEAAAQVAKVFNKPMSKDQSIARFKEEFKEAMPEFEGATEQEKGLRFVEAGLRVMAGQSPNAIENIANGLKGLGAEFAKDEKEKRAYDRQVSLSAAKYSLEQVNKNLALEEADKRDFKYFYDVSKKTKDNPYGELVAVSRAEIIANNGALPPNLKEKDLIKAEVAATQRATSELKKSLIENAGLYQIKQSEAQKYVEQLDTASSTLESSQVGIGLLAGVKARLAAGDITGFKNAAQELIRRGFAAIGKSDLLNQKYKSVAQAQADVRQAFQALIPVSLGGVQTANSISNRDVQFLADAYINSGFLQGGIFNMAFVDNEALASQLDGAIKKFRDGEKAALASIQTIEQRVTNAEDNIRLAQRAGLPVGTGPFSSEFFAPRLERAKSLAARTRTARKARGKTGRSIAEIEGFKAIFDDKGNFLRYDVRPE